MNFKNIEILDLRSGKGGSRPLTDAPFYKFPYFGDFSVVLTRLTEKKIRVSYHNKDQTLVHFVPGSEFSYEIESESSIPCGTPESPYDYCGQGIQFYTFSKKSNVYVLIGANPAQPIFETWFRVGKNNFLIAGEKLFKKMHNKAIQHQPLRGLDSLAVARFVHGFAIIAQNNQQLVCR